MTGSALAIPLLGATSAGAAEANTWDRVAECESGGMWSADLGNGHYGGLQFSQQKWEQYGGGSYAPRADLASRAQQIKVAEKLFAAEGPQAWSSCAGITGLAPGGSGAAPGGVDAADPGADSPTANPPAGSAKGGTPGSDVPEDNPAADTGSATGPDADVTTTPGADATPGAKTGPSTPTAPAAGSDRPTEPAAGSSIGPSTGPGDEQPASGTGTPGGSGGSGTKSPDAATPSGGPATPGTPAPGTPGTPADGTPGATDPAASGQGKHRGEPAPENSRPETGDSVTSDAVDERDAGRHASRDGDKSAPGSAPEPSSYTVRAGDNLSHIADEAKVPGGWPALYEANRGAVGGDPDLIKPGQSLELTEK